MLAKHSLFRVSYSTEGRSKLDEPLRISNRKTVVADELQQAIDKVIAHEEECFNAKIVISEVVRENVEVWS